MISKYRAHEITVNNVYQPTNEFCWAYALAAGSGDSIAIFDSRKRLIHYNNRFGTLDGATDDDLDDLRSLFAYYENHYIDADGAFLTISRVFQTRMPAHFTILNYAGWSCDCRAYPVLDGARLGGVVFLATRHDGPALQIGDHACEQLHPSK